jgi:NADH:ubiquinone oxidoreductase subunit B-like Fe-S oxidoreductase
MIIPARSAPGCGNIQYHGNTLVQDIIQVVRVSVYVGGCKVRRNAPVGHLCAGSHSADKNQKNDQEMPDIHD